MDDKGPARPLEPLHENGAGRVPVNVWLEGTAYLDDLPEDRLPPKKGPESRKPPWWHRYAPWAGALVLALCLAFIWSGQSQASDRMDALERRLDALEKRGVTLSPDHHYRPGQTLPVTK